MNVPSDTAARGLAERRFVAWSGYPWVVLAASLLVQTAASFGNQSVSPLAPFLVREFALSRGQVGLVLTATYLGACLVLVLAGSLSDRFGVRRLFLLGPLLAGVPLALSALAPDLLWLLLPMALYGVGNGFALPPTTRAIVEWFPPRRRGLAMGIKQTGVALAGMLCGLAVPPLGLALGWRGALAALGLATAAAGVLAFASYREPQALDAVGPRRQRPSTRAVLRQRELLLFGGVTWLFAGVQLSLVGFLVLFLQERVGLGLAEAGALLALAQAGGVMGRVGWGVVSDLLFGGRRKAVVALIAVLAACSSLALSLAGPQTPRLLLAAVLLLAGLSAIGWNGINMTFVAELAGPGASATAAGLNLTAAYLGIMACPPLFGLIVDAAGSYSVAFQAGAAASLLSLLLLWRVGRSAPPSALR